MVCCCLNNKLKVCNNKVEEEYQSIPENSSKINNNIYKHLVEKKVQPIAIMLQTTTIIILRIFLQLNQVNDH